jgi:hypothetical protein
MAISPEFFVPTSPYPNKDGQYSFPLKVEDGIDSSISLPVDKAVELLDKKLFRAAKQVGAFFRPTNVDEKFDTIQRFLFSMDSGEKVVIIDRNSWRSQISTYTVEPKNTFQDVAFKLMQEKYGLDPDVFQIDSETPHENEIIREFRKYPSQKIKGLVFERWLDYVKGTSQVTNVSWDISDNGFPLLWLNFGSFSSRKHLKK